LHVNDRAEKAVPVFGNKVLRLLHYFPHKLRETRDSGDFYANCLQVSVYIQAVAAFKRNTFVVYCMRVLIARSQRSLVTSSSTLSSLCLRTHRCLLGKGPVSLPNYCTPVPQVAARQHLRSAARHWLVVPRHRLSTYGRWAFAVAGPMTFNALPDEMRDPTVNTTTFRRLLKTHFFSSYLHD